jgi:hypothetical protein
MTQEELLQMTFHETKYLNRDTLKIMRVHNGWIYTFSEKRHCDGVGDQIAMSSVFVPR